MKTKTRIFILLGTTALSATTIYLLFLLSENIIHYKNNFTRRFPHHLATQKESIDLTFNTYYFAGGENGNVYLGNVTTPLRLTVLDSSLKIRKYIKIRVDENKKLLKAPQIRIVGSKFFLSEGVASLVFVGDTVTWYAKLKLNGGPRFSLLEPVDSSRIGMRYFHPANGKNILGMASLGTPSKNYFADSLIREQIDGIFDTDGMLRFDQFTKSFVYVHLYKNEVIVTDSGMKVKFRSKTIDTVSQARIKLTKTNKGTVTKFAVPPLLVNKTVAVSAGLLFVNSQLPGQYERDQMWKTTSIIDVYALTDGAYRSSFYIDNVKRNKLDAFLVRGRSLYAIVGNNLVRYSLKKSLQAESKKI